MITKEMVGKKRIEQVKRLEYFPKNRIPFLGTETAANLDRMTFKHYLQNFKDRGFKEVTWACAEVEKNNYLPSGSIDPELFITVAKSLGYDPYKYSGLDDDDDYE